MIIAFKNGRLGNQILQYEGLRACFPSDRLCLFDFNELNSILDAVNAIMIFPKKNWKWFRGYALIRHVIRILAAIKLIGEINECVSNGEYCVKKKNGLVRNVFLLNECFFQNKSITDNIERRICLKPYVICAASKWIELNIENHSAKELVFLHIRRGDYLIWPDHDAPAALDFSWYETAIQKVKSTVRDPVFIVVTDDKLYAHDLFRDFDDVYISDNDMYTDFSLMAKCSHGILSCSTFAWAAAWISLNRSNSDIQHLYFAPKYWVGHRSKTWYPFGFVSNWITYL